jgi:hypothetical protein
MSPRFVASAIAIFSTDLPQRYEHAKFFSALASLELKFYRRWELQIPFSKLSDFGNPKEPSALA